LKANLRAQKLLERLEHHPLQKKEKDHLIIQKILKLKEFGKAKNILFYLPIHGEVDLEELFALSHREKKFALPRVKDHLLELYVIDDLKKTEPGSFKIREPRSGLQKVDPVQLDLAFIPGVVFSENGHRIGYGKGFYDRLLKKLSCPKIGIAYDFQIVNNIDGHLHDVPMDLILSESRTINPKNS
jgi:5-formyltetrahydrofolate cyclo-ligase